MNGKNLKKIRERKNLTLDELSEESGVDLSILTDIEEYNIDPYDYEMTNRIIEALDISLEELYDEDVDYDDDENNDDFYKDQVEFLTDIMSMGIEYYRLKKETSKNNKKSNTTFYAKRLAKKTTKHYAKNKIKSSIKSLLKK